LNDADTYKVADLQRTHDKGRTSENHDETAQPPLSARHLSISFNPELEVDDEAYFISSMGVVRGSSEVQEGSDEIRSVASDSVKSVNVVEIGECVFGKFPGLPIS